MIRLIVVVILLAILVPAVSPAGVIRDGSLSASSNGTSIVVRWESEDETGVAGYMIERKAGPNGVFIPLTNPPLAARGSKSIYEYTDNSAFRITDNLYQYRITALGTNEVYYVSVRHSVSSVRRTWGSIKAMFR